MPICKTGLGIDGYRFYVNRTKRIVNGEYIPITDVKFKKDNQMHRTDGPAGIYYEGDFQNVHKVYAINNEVIDEETFKQVLNTHLFECFLYINHKFLSEIAKDKMNKRKVQVKVPKNYTMNKILNYLEVDNVI